MSQPTSTMSLKLSLNSSELEAISKTARDHKFDVKGGASGFLYADENIQRLDNFVKGYRFLFNLSNTLENETVKNKIIDYVEHLEPYFKEAADLLDRTKRQTKYSLHRVGKHIFAFLNANHEVVNNLLDVVYPMGRVVKMYDPNQSQGIY